MEKVRIFVYGTLKRGESLHYLLREARFLGEGRVKGYALYDLGEYPAARPASGEAFVWGEIYEIKPDLFEVLDEVEDEYDRQEVPVEIEDSRVITAWMYIYREPLPESKRLLSGKWGKSP
ncbi:gamma-glutamylcyclotransferase family protein [Thermosulfurimonas dismutans]|uniref:Gamma-glutamylcyclotransferase family protein n=1 Tax=Thermosulfurimonas dismutans TaxID=999894 RepID=A0A179D3S1_9BACT|nr:gamma-glutamylcyclotransferase family protein [Thermosulfurimonas dismutans]OAQ20122.1 hypothetical protein TDIS_1748 [Thermosulfurimonas dismutans]